MGGGGSGSSTNTIQNTNQYIPPWLESYGQQAVERANALSYQPYNPYPGQTVAAPDWAQQRAYEQIANWQGAGRQEYYNAMGANDRLLQQMNPITAGGIQGDTNQFNQGFQNSVYGPAQGLLGQYASQGPATAAQVASNTQQLMSPYTSAVIDPANQLMQQQLQRNLQQIGANANQAGAFGGTRQGVMEGVAQSQAALGSEQYLGNLLNSQWNASLDPATRLALQGGQQGLTASTGLANLLQGGYGASQDLASSMAGRNLQAGLQASQLQPQTLSSLNTTAMNQTAALNAAGQQAQQYQQQLLNAQQGGWQEAQAWPYQQLQTLLGAVSGIPYSTSNTGFSSETSPYYSNPYGQAIGGAAALAGGVGSILNSNAFAGNA